jgi:hypothetical protein
MSIGRSGFLGFYDWLRDCYGQIVGFRLTIADEAIALSTLLPSWGYIVRDSDYVIRILFVRQHMKLDEDASMDQDFGDTRVFRNAKGELLLTLDAQGLSRHELDQIRLLKP